MCYFLLQGIFLTQGSNLDVPHYRQTLYHLSHQGSDSFALGDIKILLQFMSKSVLPVYSSDSFMVSGLMFRPLINFDFISIYGIRKCSNFSFTCSFPSTS